MTEFNRRSFTPSDPLIRQKIKDDELSARLEALESSQTTRSAAIKGGAVTVWNNQNRQVSRFGKGTYSTANGGVRESLTLAVSTAESGFHLLIDNEEGWVQPTLPIGFVQDTFVAVTSASYVNVWKAPMHIFSKILVVQFLVACDAATTASVRLNMETINSDVVTVAALEQKVCKFSWNIDAPFDFGENRVLRVQAKRDTGAGNVNVYAPDFAYMTTPSLRVDATTGGIPLV